MKAFTEINLSGYTYWISGVHKVVNYRKGMYYAYYIRDTMKNWGDHVAPPPDRVDGNDCWKTLARAKAACRLHAATHNPSPHTVKRAAEIKASLLCTS